MRTILKICLFLMLPAAWAACVKEQTPSYVGMWEYVSSDPDLGDMYKGSYLHILKNGNFSFFDAATQTLYTGTRKDITNEGLVLYYRNEKSSEVYSWSFSGSRRVKWRSGPLPSTGYDADPVQTDGDCLKTVVPLFPSDGGWFSMAEAAWYLPAGTRHGVGDTSAFRCNRSP